LLLISRGKDYANKEGRFSSPNFNWLLW